MLSNADNGLMFSRQWQPWNIPSLLHYGTWHGWCEVYWVLTMRCLAGWLTVNSGYSDWSVVTVSAVTSGPTGGWSTTDWSRREEKSPVRCVGTERLTVPGCEAGPAGDGYRFTGYSTTSSLLLLLPLPPSVCLCRMEEVEIRPAWTLLATGGKSVSRLPSEYMITLVISHYHRQNQD